MSERIHPLCRLAGRHRLHILGVNSGTSIDGLDCALVQITDARPCPRVRCVLTQHCDYPQRLRASLRSLAAQDIISKEHAVRAHLALGSFVAEVVATLVRDGHRIDAAASHGQTIAHYPRTRAHKGGSWCGTWQIGALNAIAQQTGLVTVGDFRMADIAAGGMGAPLSGYYHHLLFGAGMPALNLGGIANISVSRVQNGRLDILAFDTGPGNMVSDTLAQILLGRGYDRDGAMARRGRPMSDLMRRALTDRYFNLRPPKTCGREQFGRPFVEWHFLHGRSQRVAPADLLATAVEVTAITVADAVNRWVRRGTKERRLVVTGGGTRNAALMQRLSFHLPAWRLCGSEEWGVPSTFVEPTGFALLARETLRGRAGNLGGATGDRKSVV